MATWIDTGNAAFYQRQAAEAFRAGRIRWGLYFLDAADVWAEPSPEQVSERLAMLTAAIKAISGQGRGLTQ